MVFFLCDPHVTAKFVIKSGVYAYVGSCGKSCLKRVTRHLNRPVKKRWHVDFLNCAALYAVVLPLCEREVAKALASRCDYIPGFGSTDDPDSPSHLFRCQLDEVLQYVGLTV